LIIKYLSFIFFILPLWGTPEQMIQKANASYQAGEKAATYHERKLAFNHALYLYHQAEQESPIASLKRAIGDTYFQLGEYAWAILYYQRALNTDPRDALATSHLEKAQQQLGLSDSSSSHQNAALAPLHTLSRNFRLLLWVICLTFLLWTLAIWFPTRRIRQFATLSSLLLLLLLSNLVFFYFFAPIEGILVVSTGFYRAPDQNQPQLTTLPLLAGSKVTILQMTSNGEWTKISNAKGLIGYIPTSTVRAI
jgi:tetratricopeptide (TPR) repeat protein